MEINLIVSRPAIGRMSIYRSTDWSILAILSSISTRGTMQIEDIGISWEVIVCFGLKFFDAHCKHCLKENLVKL